MLFRRKKKKKEKQEQKKKVTLPFGLENELVSRLLATKTGLVLSNWGNQGLRYMGRLERVHRLVSESILLIIVALFLSPYFASQGSAVVLAFIIVHTFMWIFNGHLYVLLRYLNGLDIDPQEFSANVRQIYERMQKRPYLLAAVSFGSHSRGAVTGNSDYDLTIIPRPGTLNGILACNACWYERLLALYNGFPLDAFVFEAKELASKIAADEPAVLLLDPENLFHDYPAGTIPFDQFFNRLADSYSRLDHRLN